MRLAELIGTLSLATDAGIGVADESGLATAIVAARLGALLGADAREQSDAYYLSLLRYAGCTADAHHASALFGDEVQFGTDTFGLDYGDPRQMLPAVMRNARKGKGALGGVAAMARAFTKMMAMPGVLRAHCEVASLLARRLGFDDGFRAALVQNNERWNGSGMPKKTRGEAIARAMRIAQVAQDVQIGYRLGGVDGARARVAQLSKKSLDPALAELFAKHADAVCQAIDVPSIWSAAMAAEPTPHK